ncbi:uncharacterized protein [Choristoneura fumiferana]|uniref:uncharacterized protein n=1 Tax=Choristoneura fumiferana TaxID=7141 RepID=UPI003D15B527
MAEPEPQPTSSKETDPGINPDYVNRLTNKESARFLMRILQKAEEDQKNTTGIKINNRVSDFTGLDRRSFYNNSTKLDLFKLSDLKEVEREHIHEQLMNCYIVNNVVPSTKVLYHDLFEKIPGHVDIRTFRKYLAKFGYVWIKQHSCFGIIERPEITFERYYYLRDITRYRKEKRDIIYVDEAILATGNGEYYDEKRYNRLKKAAVNAGKVLCHKDLIKLTYAVSKSGVHALQQMDVAKCNDDEFSPVALKEWLLNKLLPVLRPRSVVVIKNDKRKAEKPTLYSIKSEMMEWLDSNHVPYDETMSKCDLLTLIDTYTSEVDGKKDIESILNINGHTLLQLPFSTEKMSVAHHVFELIKLNAPEVNLEKSLDNIFSGISSKKLKAYDENIVALEKETLEIDLKVDEILDDLIANTGTKIDVDSEIPLSDSD